MRFVKSISMSFLSLVVLAACATTIPKVKVYKEIPFVDAPEGVYIESVTGTKGLINATDWAKMRPYMLMISPEGWAEIKKNWYEQCRRAGDKCNVTVDSIDQIIKTLDQIAGTVMKGI